MHQIGVRRLAVKPIQDSTIVERSTRKYLLNLPTPEDTTSGYSDRLLTPGFLRYVGELLFGERWQTPLANALGSFRGKKLAPATVHQWSTEQRSIPDWVRDALVLSLEKGQEDLAQRARLAAELSCRIRQSAFPANDTRIEIIAALAAE